MRSMNFRYSHVETREASIPISEIIDALLRSYLGTLGGDSYNIEDGKKVLAVEVHTPHSSYDKRIRILTDEESRTIDALGHLKVFFSDK